MRRTGNSSREITSQRKLVSRADNSLMVCAAEL